MAEYVLVQNDVVVNIIVADDKEWVDWYVAEQGYDHAVERDSTIDPHIAVGWLLKGKTYVAPETITVDRDTIPPDESTAAVVTYTDNRPSAAGTPNATFNVNGDLHVVPLTNGTAAISVTSGTSGDAIHVTCGGVTTVIGVD